MLLPVSQQSLQGCPRNSAHICLVEHRSVSAWEGGMSAASFLHSSFLQAINAVMLWLVHIEKVPQASEHLYPAKLQTRCDICCACQSICPFIPTDSGVPWTIDPQNLCSQRLRMAACQSGQPVPDSTFCMSFIESLRMMACVICASRWEASQTTASCKLAR